MATVEVMRALTARLIDDAGLFPPARLPMPGALAAHRAARESEQAALLGRFLVPASRLDEFALAAGRSRPEVGVVVDTAASGLDPVALQAAATTVAEFEPTSVELFLPGAGPLPERVDVVLAALRPIADTCPVYVELPAGSARAPWQSGLAALGAARAGGRHVGAKVRCAVEGADAVPESALADFVVGCRDAGVPFKATAGLHHAIRHTDADGFERHGFLNLLLACALSLRPESTAADVAAVLAERDAATVVDGIAGVTSDEAHAVRGRLLAGFGCCAPPEPVADLRALGLLEGC